MKQTDRPGNPTLSAAFHHSQPPSARQLWLGAVCALIAASIAACATFQETPQQRAQRIDPVLAAAGFHMIPADSPKKQSIFTNLPPLKMHYYVTRHGKARYWFADPYDCNCVYQGDEAAYQRYQNLRIQEKLVKEEEQTAELNQDAAIQMNAFDPVFFPY
jgi:Xaa-Pro aminopeptidase